MEEELRKPTEEEEFPGEQDRAAEPLADEQIVAMVPPSPYTQGQAAASLTRAARTVGAFCVVVVPLAWWFRGWQSAGLALVGGVISASGLWEWKRLMAALLTRMDAQDAVQAGVPAEDRKGPSVGFAIAGFVLRLLMVIAVLYVSLKYLHGSVIALAAGLAMGVIALTVEGLRLLRSGTI